MEGLIGNVMKSCECALLNNYDYQARAELMWAASLSLSGIPAAGLGRVGFPMHLLEHSLSALYDIPHGAGLAIIIPAWLEFEAGKKPHKIAHLGKNIFGIRGNSSKKIALETAAEFKKWFIKIDCPVTLKELDVTFENHAEIAENTQPLAKIWRLKEYDVGTVRTILQLCQ